jgi:hypothetical protein
MQAFVEDFLSAFAAPGVGNTEFFVAVLFACGLIMIAVSSLLPKSGGDKLEWWER